MGGKTWKIFRLTVCCFLLLPLLSLAVLPRPAAASEATFTIERITYLGESVEVKPDQRQAISFDHVSIEKEDYGLVITMTCDYFWEGDQSITDSEGVEWSFHTEKSEITEWVGVFEEGVEQGMATLKKGTVLGEERTTVEARNSIGEIHTGGGDGIISGEWEGEMDSSGAASGTFSFKGNITSFFGFLETLSAVKEQIAAGLEATAEGSWRGSLAESSTLDLIALGGLLGGSAVAAGVGAQVLRKRIKTRRAQESVQETIPLKRVREIEKEEEERRKRQRYSISVTPTVTWADGEEKVLKVQLYSDGKPNNTSWFSVQVYEFANCGRFTKKRDSGFSPLNIKLKPELSMKDLEDTIEVNGQVRGPHGQLHPLKEKKILTLKGCDLLIKVKPRLIHPGNGFKTKVYGTLIRRGTGEHVKGSVVSGPYQRFSLVFSNDRDEKAEVGKSLPKVVAEKINQEGKLVFRKRRHGKWIDSDFYEYEHYKDLEHEWDWVTGKNPRLEAKDGKIFVRGEVELSPTRKPYKTRWEEIEVKEIKLKIRARVARVFSENAEETSISDEKEYEQIYEQSRDVVVK